MRLIRIETYHYLKAYRDPSVPTRVMAQETLVTQLDIGLDTF
jgi:hypothetical protein